MFWIWFIIEITCKVPEWRLFHWLHLLPVMCISLFLTAFFKLLDYPCHMTGWLYFTVRLWNQDLKLPAFTVNLHFLCLLSCCWEANSNWSTINNSIPWTTSQGNKHDLRWSNTERLLILYHNCNKLWFLWIQKLIICKVSLALK